MEDDPLAELAKIVQGRPAGASASSRGRGLSANEQKPPSSGNAVSDLEAELLNDLQASFAAVRHAAAAPTPPQPKASSPPQPQPTARTEPAPVPEPEETFSPPAMFTRPAPPPAPPRPEVEPEVHAEQRRDPSEVPLPRFVPIPLPPVMQPPVVQRTVPEPPPERPSRAARSPLAADAKPDTRTDVGSGFQLRPTTPVASNPPPQSRQPHSRWEKPEPAKPQASTASRFAPPRGAPTPQPQPSFDDLDDDTDPFADGGVFAQGTAEDGEGEFPLDGFGLAPAYGDEDGQSEARDDDNQPAMARPRRNRGLLIAGAVIAIAIIGGVAFVLFNPGSGTSTATPPTITADSGPTKVTPDDTAAATDTDSANKLIYDRINAGDNTSTAAAAPDASTTTTPAADGANPNSRVIIPGGPGIDAPQTDDALRLDEQPDAVSPPTASDAIDAAANDTPNSSGDLEAIGPRKVRTVVVKPDGTIVSSNATDAPAANGDVPTPPATDTAAAPAPTDTATVTPPADATSTAPAPVIDDTVAISGSQAKELPITTTPDATTTPPATTAEAPTAVTPPPAAAPEPPKAVVVQPAPAPAPAPTRPTKVATASTGDQPMDLSSAPPAAAASTAAGGVLVQISSQKSEEAARTTYRDLQTRYPSILGTFDPNIQRADIPDRGTFYRVRVGPFSASDAQRLCDDLKSAGGDCVLARK
jgi:hypothetical protein